MINCCALVRLSYLGHSIVKFQIMKAIVFLICVLQLSEPAWGIEKTVCENGEAYLVCPEGQQIAIETGNYGRTDTSTCPHAQMYDTDCHAYHTRYILQEQCQGKRTCWVSAYNSVFGDPCPDTYKYLKFSYSCISHELWQFAAVGCEGETLRVDCGNMKIDMTQGGYYGRLDIVTCVSEGTSIADTDCDLGTATDHMRQKCEGKNTCDILVNPSEFGSDPCPGTDKYVAVWYLCYP